MNDHPTLITEKIQGEERLPGIVTAFDFQQQSQQLKRTRNLLLPRLISGKLSVENLEIRFPPGMAAETEVAK